MYHHTRWGSLAGLTVKRDDVTGLAPTDDLGLTDKSSFRFDSLLLTFGPGGKKRVRCDDAVKSIQVVSTSPNRFI